MLGTTVVAVLVAGGIAISPATECPQESAVAAEIARLGATAALAQVGKADVAVEGADLRIVIRDSSGAALGSRKVSAPADCQARAALAAVLIAAWAGEWMRTDLPSAPPATEARPPAPPTQVAATPLAHPHFDFDAFGFGIHDGDAGTWGAGAQASVRWKTLGIVAVAEASADRRRALSLVDTNYRFVRAGPGISARQQWSWAFADVALVPEVVRYVISGVGMARAKDLVSWQLCADLRVRFGISLGAVSPFVYAGGSWSFVRQKLQAQKAENELPVEIGSVSRANMAAGLGISVTLR